MSAFFESHLVAAILGLIYGVVLIGAYGVTAIKFTGEKAKMGMYMSLIVSFIEIIITLAVLLLYRAFAKPGAIWFGGAMAAGFVVGFILLVIKFLPALTKKK